MNKTNWTKEMHLKALTQINKEINTKDWNTLLKEVANNIEVKVSSLKMAISNYKFIVLGEGMGLQHYNNKQLEAVNEFIQQHGKKLFIKL